MPHGYAADLKDAAIKGVQAGVDMEMSSNAYALNLKALVDAGQVAPAMIDDAVRNILRVKFRRGLFDRVAAAPAANPSAPDPDALATARKLATESIVLLKNDGSLPLAKTIQRIAVIGPNANDGRSQLGDYSYAAMKALLELRRLPDSSFVNIDATRIEAHAIRITTVLEGIQAAMSEKTQALYAKGCENLDDDRSRVLDAA